MDDVEIARLAPLVDTFMRNRHADELLARLDYAVNVLHADFCIGEDQTRALIEDFRNRTDAPAPNGDK